MKTYQNESHSSVMWLAPKGQGALNLLTWLKGGYLKNMGAISRDLEIIWVIWAKNNFSSAPPPLQLQLWLVPNFEVKLATP